MQSEEKKEEKVDTLKEDLIEFLTFKYYLNNTQLQDELEDEEKNWKKKFSDWSAIRSILTLKPTPSLTETFPYFQDRGITVILPRDDKDPELNFQFLKGAAYFPYQLDPDGFFYYAQDEDILIQLAFAAYHGYCRASFDIATMDTRFRLLKGHPICIEESSLHNYGEFYYELPLPEKFYGMSSQGKKTLPFNPNTDAIHLRKFFDVIAEIAKTGKRPEDIDYHPE